MSENYVRVDNQMSSQGINLLEKIKAMINREELIKYEESSMLNLIESMHISNEKFVGKIEWDRNKILKNSDKWSEADMKIKDYFEQQVTSLPLVYIDVNTSFDTSFKLSDQAIVCFDKEDNSLKKISTLNQQIDLDLKKKFLKDIIIKKQTSDIFKEFWEVYNARNLNDKELQQIKEDFLEEEIIVVKLSQDKRNIILGTSQGGLMILNAEDFKVKYSFKNPNKSRVIDVVEKQNFIGVGYQNGSITIYKRPLPFVGFSGFEIKQADDYPIRALKLSKHSDHLIAIQDIKHLNDQQFDTAYNISLQHDEALVEKNQLILYNVKDMKEIGRTQLISFKCQNFELKKYFEFSKDCFIVRSPDFCSFRVHSLKNCYLISQGPDNIDASTIQFIKSLPDQKHLLVVSYNGDSYFYDLHGQEVLDPSNLQTPSYMISPCGTSDLQLLSLPDRVQLFQFRKTLNSQLTLFEKDEQCLYFSDKKDSFIIQLSPIKPKFKEIINGIISTDQTLFFYTYKFLNIQYMEITDLQSGNVLKTFKQHQPITTSYNSKFLFCEDVQKKILVKINLQTFKSEIIKESTSQMLVLNKQGDLMFYQEKDEKTNKYKLIVIDINSKQVIGVLDKHFDEEFSFQISNNQNYLILSTKNNQLLKIDCENYKSLKVLKTINHEGGYCPNISFDFQDNYFICGGELSSDLHIYNLKTMNSVASIHNHSQSSCFGYFVSQNRIVTKQNDKLIYWNWNGKLELLFKVNEESKIIGSFNQQMAGLIRNNEISLWNEEFIHELSDSLSDIQPNNLRKQWIVGPLVLVYQLILNNFYSVNEQEKVMMLPHLLNYTVLPYGYTFLSKLIFSNQNLLVKEALKTKNLAYVRDINDNSPLNYAIKRKDFETLENLLKFLAETKKYISQIQLNTWIQLIQLAPSSLSPFLDQASIIITDKFNSMGQKIDDENQTYFEKDSQSRLVPEQVYEKLLNQEAQETDKYTLQFTQSLINLNNQLGSKESILFSQALEDCPDEKIFKNLLVDKLLKNKWSKMKSFANFLLVMQILFTLNVSIHSFTPGDARWIHILSIQNYFWAIIEFIIFVQSDFTLKYNSKLNIWLFILLQIYGSNTLESASPNIDKLLPLINWLAWFQLVTQLQQFELIRTFYCIFLGCITAIDGFCYFLLLMIFTFSTTQDIIIKNNERAEKYGDDRAPYSVKFYEDHNITQTFDQNVKALWDAFFTTWVTIVKGDFAEDDAFVWRMFVLLSTFISNVVLLNLIIAFMSDAYGEVMSTVFEKKNKTLNYMTLRLEKVIFWKKNKGKRGFLIWADYTNEIKYIQANKTQELSEIVEIQTQKSLNEFLKYQKIMFSSVQTQIVQTRQKISNLINTSEKVQVNNQQMNISSNQPNNQIEKYFSQMTAQLNQINMNVNSTLEAQQIQQKQLQELKSEVDKSKTILVDHINDQLVKDQIDKIEETKEANSKLNKSKSLNNTQMEKYFSQTSVQLNQLNINMNSTLEVQQIQQKQLQEIKNELNKRKSQLPDMEKLELTSLINTSLKNINSEIVQEVKSNNQTLEVQFQGLVENLNQLKSNLFASVLNSSIKYDSVLGSQELSPQESKQKLDQYQELQQYQSTQGIKYQSQQQVKQLQDFQLIDSHDSVDAKVTKDFEIKVESSESRDSLISQDKFDQIQFKLDKEIKDNFKNYQVQFYDFMRIKLNDIQKQIENSNPKISKQDQLQNILNNLSEMKYQIKKEININIKNLGTNLQNSLTEKLLQIINKLSEDLIIQIQNSSNKSKVINQEKASPNQKLQRLSSHIDFSQKQFISGQSPLNKIKQVRSPKRMDNSQQPRK